VLNKLLHSMVLFGLLAVVALASTSCSTEPPEDGVQIKVTNSLSKTEADNLLEILKRYDPGISTTTLLRISGEVTINLSPVSDVQAFADKIKCGEVISVEGRIITLKADKSKI